MEAYKTLCTYFLCFRMKLKIDLMKFLMIFFVSHFLIFFLYSSSESVSMSYLNTFFILSLVSGSSDLELLLGEDESLSLSEANLKSYSSYISTLLLVFWLLASELWPESEDCFSFFSSSVSRYWLWISCWVKWNCSLIAAIRRSSRVRWL